MAANTLAVSYTVLTDEVQRALAWRKASGSWSSIQTADFGAGLASGLRWTYYPPVLPEERAPHIWSFRSQVGNLTVRAPYSTGTVTIVAGVATLSGGTWPSWTASADLWISGVRYSVNTRDSNSQLTLNDTSVAASAGTAYELIQHYYELPSDFGSLIGDGFAYPRSDTTGDSPLKRVTDMDIRLADRNYGATGWPTAYSISYIAPSGSDDARQQVSFFPITGQDRTLEYRYEVIPPLLTGASGLIYHHGGPWLGELLISAVVAETIRKVDGYSPRYEAAHASRMEQLRTAVGYDRRASAVESLGVGAGLCGESIEDVVYELRRDIPAANMTFDV